MSLQLRCQAGRSVFALEDGKVYHTYSAYARGLDASGPCTNGFIARLTAATNKVFGFAGATNFFDLARFH